MDTFSSVCNMVNTGCSIVILGISMFTFYLSYWARKIHSLDVSFNYSLQGNYLSVYLENLTLRPVAIKEVYLLSKMKNKCYCFPIRMYDTPVVLKVWGGLCICQRPYAQIYGCQNNSEIINNCIIIIKDVAGKYIIAKGKHTKTRKWLVESVRHKKCETPILVSKYFMGNSISDVFKFYATINNAVTCCDTDVQGFLIDKNGCVYQDYVEVGKILTINNEELTPNIIRLYVANLLNVETNQISVQKLEQGLQGFIQIPTVANINNIKI